MAILETEMVSLDEVMLPYLRVKGTQTLYQVMQHQHFLLGEAMQGEKDA